jgi:ketosteroid isomerase-like protein
MNLTPDLVKSEIQRYWNAFTSKSADALAEFFAHESTVFGSTATRAEPGRLAAARRKREYFGPQSTVRAQIGPIDVVMLGTEAAVATYNLDFHASKVAGALGATVEEHIEHARVTQVFAHDPEGHLRIVHEHISMPYKT